MRIAIDIRRINEFGIGTYIWNLVRNLSQVDSNNEYLLAGSDRNFQELGPLRSNFTQLYQARFTRLLERIHFTFRWLCGSEGRTSFTSRIMIARSCCRADLS